MVVAIIAILTSVASVSYRGSVDASEIKATMPGMIENLDQLRDRAKQKNAIVVIEFLLGTHDVHVRLETPDGERIQSERRNILGRQILKRPLKFRDYRWPNGDTEPATFRYFPTGLAQGGTLYFGTAFAEVRIRLSGDQPVWNFT
mgnify:FL=1